MTKTILGAALLTMLGLPWAGAARADCDGDITRLQAQVDRVINPRVKQLVEFDIKSAEKESGELDDAECKEAVDHADKLMASAKP